jgi:tRNA-uridine 2-sulfurtransferase
MRIAVGLSGGVDSSVAALLLKEQGHDVVGIMMALWDGKRVRSTKRHACYGPDEPEDIESARVVCGILGIPFHVFDCARSYRGIVLDHFRNEYLEGRTPNPCVICNHTMKFGILPEMAHGAGLAFEKFATGHYARTGYDENLGRFYLKKAADARKDQSYFLYLLSQEQLASALFPLGNLFKEDVRNIARTHGLPVSEREESQDFYGGDFKELLPAEESRGKIVTSDGRVLGTHGGIWNYTLGQRKGLGIGHSEPLYVIRIDKGSNAVVVGPRKELEKRAFVASSLNWMAIEKFAGPLKAGVKIRSTHEGKPAMLESAGEDAVTVTFDAPVDSITPGQSAVFYREEIVIGGGTIKNVI